jgi:hypothetical protein
LTRLPFLAAAAALLAGPVLAQTGPQIRTMPMPPSASDPAPKETGASPRASGQPKKPARARAKAAESDGGLAAPPSARTARRGAASTGEDFQRPKRFVPEEFDRGGEDDGSRAKPFMSPSGRAGVGMRF